MGSEACTPLFPSRVLSKSTAQSSTVFFDYGDITNLLKVPAKVTIKSDGIYFDFVLELLPLYEKVSVPVSMSIV